MSSSDHPSTLMLVSLVVTRTRTLEPWAPKKNALHPHSGKLWYNFEILSETSQNNLLILLEIFWEIHKSSTGRKYLMEKIYCSIISSIVIIYNRRYVQDEISIRELQTLFPDMVKIWGIVKTFLQWCKIFENRSRSRVCSQEWEKHHKLSPSKSVCLTNIFSLTQFPTKISNLSKGEFEKFSSTLKSTSNWCGKKSHHIWLLKHDRSSVITQNSHNSVYNRFIVLTNEESTRTWNKTKNNLEREEER